MVNRHSLQLFILVFSLAVAVPSAVAQVVIATVPIGPNDSQETSIAVNSVTNKIYVASEYSNKVTIIDGASNNITTIDVGAYPYDLAVNSATNKIYVANLCGYNENCSYVGTVTVIDGATNNTTTVRVGYHPVGVAVNPVTNKIYVANSCGDNISSGCPYNSPGTVTVIDGDTNNTATVSVGVYPWSVAVDAVTNKIYVTNVCGNDTTCMSPGTVTVIDGASNNTTAVTVGYQPAYLAINPATNKVYVANWCVPTPPYCYAGGNVTVIDGATNNTTTVQVGNEPWGIAVNPVTNKIYVANSGSANVTVIDGATNNTATVTAGALPWSVAVDAVTNKVYVSNYFSNNLGFDSAGTVTVIDGATNNTVPVAVGDEPEPVAVNATTDRIYVGNAGDGTASVIVGDTGLQFVVVTPCRVVDTRNSDGTFGGPPIQGGTYRSFPISQGSCNIPATAAAYSLNVTAVPYEPLGYLTIWPAGERWPVASTTNSLDGRVKANAAIIPAGVSGGVSVFVSNTSDVALDIDGYFTLASNSTLTFYPLTPCRVADTRYNTYPQGLGAPSLSGGVPRDFPILESTCNIPNSAQAYSLNFTAVPHGPLGYLTVWPAGDGQPYVSTLNAPTGQTTANAAIVPAGTGGAVSTFAYNDTDLVIDINGYFAAPGQNGLSLYPAAPCRVLDTRHNGIGQFVGKIVVDTVDSVCGPSNLAQAYVFNATVVPPGPLGHLTLWPDGGQQPGVSTLNAVDGAVMSNMAIVPTNDGKIDAFASNLTQLILDISAYFAP